MNWRILKFVAPATALAALLFGLLQREAKAVSPTIVTFPWDWVIVIQVNQGSPTNPVFGPPLEIPLWGTATVAFGQPTDLAGNTFDLGPGGGLGAPIPQPVPPGTWEIPIEIVQLELRSIDPTTMQPAPVDFGIGRSDVFIRESPSRPTTGKIQNLENIGGGQVAMDSFFDIFTEITLPGFNMNLRNVEPVRAGMSFGRDGQFPPGDPLPEIDILWGPTWLWAEGFGRDLLDDAGNLWDKWISIHAHVTVPEPSGLAMATCGGLLLAIGRRWRRRFA